MLLIGLILSSIVMFSLSVDAAKSSSGKAAPAAVAKLQTKVDNLAELLKMVSCQKKNGGSGCSGNQLPANLEITLEGGCPLFHQNHQPEVPNKPAVTKKWTRRPNWNQLTTQRRPAGGVVPQIPVMYHDALQNSNTASVIPPQYSPPASAPIPSAPIPSNNVPVPPSSSSNVAPGSNNVLVSLSELQQMMLDYVNLKKMYDDMSKGLSNWHYDGTHWVQTNQQMPQGSAGNNTNSNGTSSTASTASTASTSTTRSATAAPVTQATTRSTPPPPPAPATPAPTYTDLLRQCTSAMSTFKSDFDVKTAKMESHFERYTFYAQRRTEFSSLNQFVTYNDVPNNTMAGKLSSFSPTTGLFTAPVNGTYFFYFTTIKPKAGYGGSDILTVQLILNNSTFMAEGFIDAKESQGFFPIFVQATYELMVGNTVGVKFVAGQKLHGEGEGTNYTSTSVRHYTTTFTGFLIQPKM